MNNQEVAHRWAQRRDWRGKGSNFFFEGETLYSYGRHFIVAKHVESPKGHWFVVVNPDTYSPSTSRHQSYARRALPIYYDVIHVTPGNTPEQWVAELMERYKEQYGRFKRARSNKSWYAEGLDKLHWQLAFLNEQYDLDLELPTLENVEALIEEAQRREDERQRAKDLLVASEVSEWKLGVRAQCPHTRDVHLRVKDANIETSWGANVPLEVAPFVWRTVQMCIETKSSYVPIDSDVRLGHYTLNKIDEHGNIVVGCHTIRYNELRRIAVQLGYCE
jgi:hypothetical protein